MARVEEVYETLLEKFGEKEFTLEDAKKVLTYDEKSLLVILKRLKDRGLLSVRKDEADLRKSIYKLQTPKIEGKNTFDKLKNMLKKAADLIRGKAEYEILLILLFYKAYSDIWKQHYEEFIKEAEELGDVIADVITYEGIKIPKDCLWDEVITASEYLVEAVKDALIRIGDVNPQIKESIEKFTRYFDSLISSEGDLILRQVINVFNQLKFTEKDLESDILGQAYEWYIGYFAPQKAKAGELFTPREVVKLLVELLEPNEIKRKILDPAAGSGGMLIYAYKFVKEKYGEDVAKKLVLVGQEVKDINFAIMELNFLLHKIGLGKNVKLYQGDSLLDPKFKDEKFDIVMFNPPWNIDYPEETLKKSAVKEAFKYGYPPNNTADWGWIQLALYFTNEMGKVGIVIDAGCLFRGGREKAIREKIIEEDLIECVILLPEKLFYNAGAPGVIIIFNKNKLPERKGKILFINASKYYEKHPEVRKLNRLTEDGIKKIVEVYKEWKEIEGFSRIVDIETIKEFDYNLNVPLYVFEIEEEEDINIKEVWDNIKIKNEVLKEIDAKIDMIVEETLKAEVKRENYSRGGVSFRFLGKSGPTILLGGGVLFLFVSVMGWANAWLVGWALIILGFILNLFWLAPKLMR
jgi:type I restriction enzyme M protein